MNNGQKGLALSIIIHGMVLTAFILLSMDKRPIHLRAISLDFAILNFQEHGERPGSLDGDRHGGAGPEVKKRLNPDRPVNSHANEKPELTAPAVESPVLNSSVSSDMSGIISDKDGNVEIHGKAGALAGEGEKGDGGLLAGTFGQSSGLGYRGGDGRTIRYGTGSSDEKAFHYIRVGIMKNVKYPEKARRKGMTGRILLSFTVSEGGFTRDIKVINSSGFIELDNSAKEAITRTSFSQKIPYRLYVILPIEYRLE